ncbi:hypothetical protein RLEG3_03050 (plasmid) [Rhizobium leguminosarum bv. trifolii WSM1689]|nr:hypothetical protein RLEG3_03050 [Rhizobium leguminosarum bv. trifolii WSM1689]
MSDSAKRERHRQFLQSRSQSADRVSDAKPLQIRAHSIQAKFGDQQIGVADFYETTQQTHVAGYAF